jgi:hypothetical protein
MAEVTYYPDAPFFVCCENHRHRFGWMGLSMAFGSVVRKP